VSTLVTDMASLLLACAGSVGGELPNYLKLHVLPHLSITSALQVSQGSLNSLLPGSGIQVLDHNAHTCEHASLEICPALAGCKVSGWQQRLQEKLSACRRA
jgi:hypothetical protein